MIVFSLFITDLIFHFAVIVLISAYLRFLFTDRTNNYIFVAFLAAAILTFVNHTYYPQLRWVRYSQTGSE